MPTINDFTGGECEYLMATWIGKDYVTPALLYCTNRENLINYKDGSCEEKLCPLLKEGA